MPPVERTADGRYIVVDGRRWRATDPSIPPQLAAELVKELMAARREVRVAGDHNGDLAAARRRVADAKVALGERGRPWWEPPAADARDARIRSAARALLRARGPGKSICPSDVARIAGSPDWRPLMDRVRSVAAGMAEAGELVVTARGEPMAEPALAAGPIRYRAGSALDPIGS